MNRFTPIVAAVVTSFLLQASARCAEYELESSGAPPDGLTADVRQSLEKEGHRVTGPSGTLCEIWLVKSPQQKDGFAAGFRVKYPFEVGALVGVLRVGENGEFTDFRDQVILPGLYTLRYAQQPQDGNHIGTSPLADFLLAVPAEEDKSPVKLDDPDELNAVSAVAAGSAHPAIFSLRPTEEADAKEAKLSFESGDEFWVLQTPAGENRPALRLVVVGFGGA